MIADSLFIEENYGEALNYYRTLKFDNKDYHVDDLLIIAKCYWKFGKKDSCYHFVNTASSRGVLFPNDSALRSNGFLKEVASEFPDSNIYSKFHRNIKMKNMEEILHPQLKDRLIELNKLDQKYRPMLSKGTGGLSKDSLLKLQNNLDHYTRKSLDSILSVISWPTIDLVGREASNAAWLIAQHSDEDVGFQIKCYSLIREAFLENKINRENFAYITDRILINLNFPQLYGTQFSIITLNDGKKDIEFKPISNIDFVDFRRRFMGMPPIKIYKEYSLRYFNEK